DRGTPPGPPPFPDRAGVHTAGPIPLPLSARAADPDLADGSLPRRRPTADPEPAQTLTGTGWQPDVLQPAAAAPGVADPATDVAQGDLATTEPETAHEAAHVDQPAKSGEGILKSATSLFSGFRSRRETPDDEAVPEAGAPAPEAWAPPVEAVLTPPVE